MHRRAVLRALEEASDAGEIPDATLADLEAITAGVDPDAAASETDGDGLDSVMAGQDGHGGGPSSDGDQEEHDDRSGPGARDGQKGRAGRGGHGARNSQKGEDGLGDHGGQVQSLPAAYAWPEAGLRPHAVGRFTSPWHCAMVTHSILWHDESDLRNRWQRLAEKTRRGR